MWYAITGGAGIALGLGMMIFGLVERSKRHKAERAKDQAEQDRERYREASEKSALAALDAEAEAKRFDEQLVTLRRRLAEARERLAKSGDPKAIKEWLDFELSAEDL